MKVVVLTGIRQMELKDVPEPSIKKDADVLLKIEKVGVCGSDVYYYTTGGVATHPVEYPYIVGHECSATVAAVGSEVSQVKEGDKVAVDPAIVCHHCDQCRQSRKNTCRNMRYLATPPEPGCLCEYIVMPQDCLYPLNGKITMDQAALCEPLTIGVYAVQLAHMPDSASVAVFGVGPIGLSCMLAAKAEGASRIFATETIGERAEIAKKAGTTWVGNPLKENIVEKIIEQEPTGIDVVFKCAGDQKTTDQAIEVLKPGGKLVLIDIPKTERVSFIIAKLRRKEITVINPRRQNNCIQRCIDLLASGKINADFMVTHRFKLEQTQDAFDMVAEYRDGVVKALIEF